MSQKLGIFDVYSDKGSMSLVKFQTFAKVLRSAMPSDCCLQPDCLAPSSHCHLVCEVHTRRGRGAAEAALCFLSCAALLCPVRLQDAHVVPDLCTPKDVMQVRERSCVFRQPEPALPAWASIQAHPMPPWLPPWRAVQWWCACGAGPCGAVRCGAVRGSCSLKWHRTPTRRCSPGS